MPTDPLRHHGDVEAAPGLLDFAVNVYPGPRPAWLSTALRESLDDVGAYPDPRRARAALARRHGRAVEDVLPTAGAAEAFWMVARLRPWKRPVVVHPQFTEPHVALEQAGHPVSTVLLSPEDGFRLDPSKIPDDADLVVLGNPTNPTGVLHSADQLRSLARPGRLVVVDEAFLDAVPGEPESLAGRAVPGLMVLRSLTKQWSIPGIRAGYLLAEPEVVLEAAAGQVPWSVSTPAIAAMIACSSDVALLESHRRAETLQQWRAELEDGLRERRFVVQPSVSPFVLAKLGTIAHAALRDARIAVRRADTFPGLDASWVRIAARPTEVTRELFRALDRAVPHPVAMP